MGATHLKMLKLLLLLGLTEICMAQTAPGWSVSVYTVTSKSMTMTWARVSGAGSYRITATPTANPAASSGFAQFRGNSVMGAVNSLTPNTMYTMLVEAISDSNTVLASGQLEHKTAPDVPATPEQAYSKQSNSITLEFDDHIAGAHSYILRAESDVGGEQYFSETIVTQSPGTVTGLHPYTEYTLRVMSVNDWGRSQPSYPVLARTVVEGANMNTSSPSNDTILATWPPVEHAVRYSLSIIQEGTDIRYEVNTNETTWIFAGLVPGTRYSIKITAWDAEGRPGDDVTEYQYTRPSRPNNVMVESFGASGRNPGLTVFWNISQGADWYSAYSSNGQNCSTLPNTPSTPINPMWASCIMVPVACGQNQTVVVIAENRAGPSSPSDPVDYVTRPCPPEQIWVMEEEPGNCTVGWSEVDWVEYYVVFIKRDDGREEHCNNTGTDTACHYHCLCGYTYLHTVFAYNQAGSSDQGPVVNYTTIPCCPEPVTINLISTETLEITWPVVRGAELYETTAAERSDVIHCNDTAPRCALSDLSCNTVFAVVVTPCSELRGCNLTCRPHAAETAPCAPDIVSVTQSGNASTFRVVFSTPNTANTNYTVTAVGHMDTHSCHTQSSSCDLTQLPCGSNYEVMAVARTAVGRSLPSYTMPLETGPCCPTFVDVTQVTQAMSNVTWSAAQGARSYMTALTSPRGEAKCHTLDTHCVMGCITCGTNYSVNLEAISSTGHKTQCSYEGFSSSRCCPNSVKLYRMASNSLRVYWRSSGPPQTQNHVVDMYGTASNYTCNPPAGSNSCDVQDVMCGDVYTVVVAPVGQDGELITFCPHRMYSVSCAGSNVGMVIYRGKRSVD